ncbi:hypothetical protein [Pseudomonas sp. TCU-HL1]|uniref:hypothetical protein n=1 Tax=Pseudomonas sp. TCU-HL1 TaxID=1856685 RepID=UPI00083D2D88|nr:hypothetical protein [Pseudomonas sp. TCU-HL1]AOE88107.1 hypothetical protein THL1_5560 [Pseudomonas sp. TCU-HL1]
MPEVNLERLNEFCEAWLRKAQACDNSIAGVFDRFFALWIVFNRLYEESARILINENDQSIFRFRWKNKKPYGPPPDRMAATIFIVRFCGENTLRSALTAARRMENALHFIESGQLYLHEDYTTGEPDYDRDQKLVQCSRQGDIQALMALIYQARCNLFHGQKAYSDAQRPLLEGMNEVLQIVIRCAQQKMQQRTEAQPERFTL